MIAVAVAAVLLVTVVLPAEYGIDPTRIGRVLGLTQMGEIKTALAKEAEPERANTSPAPKITQAAPTAESETKNSAKAETRKDEMSVTLKPGEGAKVKYEWTTSGGAVNHDTHGDNPQIDYHGYSKGQQMERDAGIICLLTTAAAFILGNRAGDFHKN